MSQPTPFKIAISDSRLERLNQKLALIDFPPSTTTPPDDWSRGVPIPELVRLVKYWQTTYSWRTEEEILNRIPQFITPIEVDGFGEYNIHFIHQKSSVDENAIPLLFLHGWPGTFLEVSKMLGPLTEGEEGGVRFHVVAPSLVDFGFSDASGKAGFNINQHAEAYHKLMLSLGYSKYAVQGGDFGYLITRTIAKAYSPNILAYHLNNSAPAPPPETTPPTPLSPSDVASLGRSQAFFANGAGYMRLLSTKPLSLSPSLTDSPLGLLAFIYTKLHDWTDAYTFADDEILTWVSIYYFSTAGPGAPGNLYFENEHSKPAAFEATQGYIDVPVGIARFEKDVMLFPQAWNGTLGKVVYESVYEKGGHFAGWERPDALVGDLRKMFEEGGPVFGVLGEK